LRYLSNNPFSAILMPRVRRQFSGNFGRRAASKVVRIAANSTATAKIRARFLVPAKARACFALGIPIATTAMPVAD
jgi:hypothetical protein